MADKEPRYDPARSYQVTGAYVTVKTATPNGPMVVGLYEGASWPKDATVDAGQHHLVNRLIREVPAPAVAAPPELTDEQRAAAAKAAEAEEKRILAEAEERRKAEEAAAAKAAETAGSTASKSRAGGTRSGSKG